jgi:hypothetical protein
MDGNYRKEYLDQISKQNADREAVRAAAKEVRPAIRLFAFGVLQFRVPGIG